MSKQMSKKKREELEDLLDEILEQDRKARKQVKLDESKAYYLSEAEFDYGDDSDEETAIRKPPVVPKVGDVVETKGTRLLTAAGIKGHVTSTQGYRLSIDPYVEDGEIPLKSQNNNNFADAVIVEVETRVTRVFRAHDLKDISDNTKPCLINTTEPEEDWRDLDGKAH